MEIIYKVGSFVLFLFFFTENTIQLNNRTIDVQKLHNDWMKFQ